MKAFNSFDKGACFDLKNNTNEPPLIGLENTSNACKLWLLNNLINEDVNTYNVNFDDLIRNNGNIIALQMNRQHIGSCSFTNHIYYSRV